MIRPTVANKIAFALVCFIIIFTTLAYGAVHQPVIAAYYVAVAAAAVCWAIDLLLAHRTQIGKSDFLIPGIAVCVYGILQIIPFGSVEIAGVNGVARTISLDPYWTAAAIIHVFSLVLFLFVFRALLGSAARLRKVAVLITIFGFLFAFYAILQSVLSPTKIYGIYESRFSTPFGSFVNRHNFAAYMEMTAAIPLGLVFSGAVARDKRLLYVIAALLMIVALFLSGSRGGLVAIIAELIILVLLTTAWSGKRKLALRVALVIALFGAVVAGAVFVGGDTSLTRLAETAADNDVSTGRSQIWAVTLEVIKNNPLGAGLGAFPVAYANYDPTSGLERVEQAHNDYLQAAADMGVLGIAIVAGFLYLFLRMGKRLGSVENQYRRALGIAAFVGCCGVLVHSLFDFVLHTTALAVLFVVLLGVSEASLSAFSDDFAPLELERRFKKKRGTVSPLRQPTTKVAG